MSASEIVTTIIGSGGALGALGAGGKFVWGKIEARFQRIEEDLRECRRREAQSRERRAIQLTVIELLWQKVREVDPSAPVLTRAKKLLDDLKDMAVADPGDH